LDYAWRSRFEAVRRHKVIRDIDEIGCDRLKVRSGSFHADRVDPLCDDSDASSEHPDPCVAPHPTLLAFHCGPQSKM
jgi:hypothetical protein